MLFFVIRYNKLNFGDIDCWSDKTHHLKTLPVSLLFHILLTK